MSSPLSRVLERAREAFAAWDAAYAKQSLDRFEARRPPPLPAAAFAADTPMLRTHVRAAGKAKVVHHWATWCDACVAELPLVWDLVERLGDGVDVVGVSWDTFQGEDPTDAVVKRVSDTLADISLPTAVYTGTPDALFDALHLTFRQIPQTQVLDPDGGLLRSFDGPLDDDDIRQLVELLA
jgi:thiol-disulfide isomerase/thioredoxin